MEERFIEIRFCYWIKKVMVEFRYSYHILDVIDAYCLLGDVDSTLIKQLMQQVKKNAGPITTNKEETCYIARKLDYSFREIQSLTGISLGSQSRIQEMLKNYSEFDILKPCIATDYHEAVRRFMRVVDIMKGV